MGQISHPITDPLLVPQACPDSTGHGVSSQGRYSTVVVRNAARLILVLERPEEQNRTPDPGDNRQNGTADGHEDHPDPR